MTPATSPLSSPRPCRLATFAVAGRKTLHALAIVLFILMVLLVLGQVIARKFFDPLVWSEELARYVFIWVMFLGWFIATERGSHIAIGMIRNRVGARARLALDVFAALGTLVLMIWLIIYGCQLVANNSDVETVTLFFSFAVVYAIVPMAGAAIAVLTITQLWQRLIGTANADAPHNRPPEPHA